MKLIGYYNTKTETFICIEQYQRINSGKGFKTKAVEHIIEVFGGSTPKDIILDYMGQSWRVKT